jgi:hypothetical protein
MRTKDILHCCINLPDLDEGIVFFRDLLGFGLRGPQVVLDPQWVGALVGLEDPELLSATVELPTGNEIELLEFRRPRTEQTVTRRITDVGISVLTLVVEGIDDLVERLTEAGYPPVGEVVHIDGGDNGDARAVHVHGPGGVPVTLLERVG